MAQWWDRGLGRGSVHEDFTVKSMKGSTPPAFECQSGNHGNQILMILWLRIQMYPLSWTLEGQAQGF